MGGMGTYKHYRKVKAQTGASSLMEKKVKVNEAELQRVKAYVEYEESVEQKQEYVKHSILINLDAMHKFVGSIHYSFGFPDGQDHGMAALAALYGEEVLKQETLEFILAHSDLMTDVSYLKEIMTIDLASVPGSVAIIYSYNNEEQIGRFLDATQQYFEEKPTLGVLIGGAYTFTAEKSMLGETVDTALLDAQVNRKADLAAMQNQLAMFYDQLTENEIRYLELYRDARGQEEYEEGQPLVKTEEAKAIKPAYIKNFLKGACKGAVGGALVGLAIATLCYLFSPVLLDAENIYEMYRIPVVAARRLHHPSDNLADQIVSILTAREHDGTIALITTQQTVAESDLICGILQKLKAGGVDVRVASAIGTNPAETDKLKGIREAYFVESVYHTRHRKLEQQIMICKELRFRINGAFVL